MNAAAGRFVWFDLNTTDIQGGKSFYSDVIGWKNAAWAGGDYELWVAGKDQIGGIMSLPEEERRRGSAPYWLGYVAVEDVDATAKQAEKLGGRVLVPGTDIPQTGRFAVLADPQGAVFAIFKSAEQQTVPANRELGHFSWAELNTSDWKSAWTFYSKLLGWKPTSSMDMGPEYGEYFMFGMDPKQPSMGGMSNSATMMKAPPHWLHYVNVKSVDDVVKRIPERGGKVVNGPMDVPGGDRIAQCLDPQGGMFAIFSSGSGT